MLTESAQQAAVQSGEPHVAVSFAQQVAQLDRRIEGHFRRQIPFAAALALTRTAQLARDAITARLPQTFDRPTPFTQRGVSYRPASKANLTATVLVLPRQAAYLTTQETGGIGRPAGRAFALPRVPELADAYGNIGRGAIGRVLGRAKGQAFVGTIRGTPGVWRREARSPSKRNGGVKLLVRFLGPSPYQPRFGFQAQAAAVARREFPRLLAESLQRAIETARD